eukprot:Skav225729  [mRNA]  locus=scaffold611:73724:78515:+ [translate_table: standard]
MVETKTKCCSTKKHLQQAYYVAAQPGVHTLPDGRVFEAGQVETMSLQFQTQSCKPKGGVARWDTVQFQGSFTSPVVVTKLQTANNENGTPPNGPSTPWLTPAVDSVTSSSFLVALDSGETEVAASAAELGLAEAPSLVEQARRRLTHVPVHGLIIVSNSSEAGAGSVATASFEFCFAEADGAEEAEETPGAILSLLARAVALVSFLVPRFGSRIILMSGEPEALFPSSAIRIGQLEVDKFHDVDAEAVVQYAAQETAEEEEGNLKMGLRDAIPGQEGFSSGAV